IVKRIPLTVSGRLPDGRRTGPDVQSVMVMLPLSWRVAVVGSCQYRRSVASSAATGVGGGWGGLGAALAAVAPAAAPLPLMIGRRRTESAMRATFRTSGPLSDQDSCQHG